MTLIPLTDCCVHLGVDPKTLRCWLKAAQLAACLHPSDARIKCLTDAQLAQVARLHERHLPDPAELAPDATAHPSASSLSATSELATLRSQVVQLQAQILTLQTQLTDLALTLLQRPGEHVSPPLPTPKPSRPVPVTAPEPPLPPLTRGTIPANRPRSQALIQVRDDGSYVLITPDQGVLPIVPDSPEWFDWITSLRSFRFQGKNGSYGATRKVKKGHAVAAFHIHFSRHGRSCNLYLSFFPAITIARLEEMATAALARTTHP